MDASASVLTALLAEGFDFYCGVPCSYLEGLFHRLEQRPGFVAATREDLAVGMAVGAWLGGRQPVVLLQNSGLGTALNALVSLPSLYRVPVLLVTSWRGEGGRDAPEHVVMGEITPRLLDLAGIEARVLDVEQPERSVAEAAALVRKAEGPAALIVRKGACQS